jgi:hypothetical protein
MKEANSVRLQPMRDGSATDSGRKHLLSVDALVLQPPETADLVVTAPADLFKRTNRSL